MAVHTGTVGGTSYVRRSGDQVEGTGACDKGSIFGKTTFPFNYQTNIATNILSLIFCKFPSAIDPRSHEYSSVWIKWASDRSEYFREFCSSLVDLPQNLKNIGLTINPVSGAGSLAISEKPNFRFLEGELRQSFEKQAVDDGYIHPAENILLEFIKWHRETAFSWIKSIILTEDAYFVASVITCLGRLNTDIYSKEILDILGEALEHPNVFIRDAAAKALEACRNSGAAILLANHIEKVSWLKDYIDDVLSDMTPS